MRLSRTFLIALILALAAVSWAKIFPPEGKHKTIYIRIKGKKYRYWKCDKKIEFIVDGEREGKLFIRTVEGKKPKIKIYLDGDKIKEFVLDEKVSKKAKSSVKNITRARVVKVKIPKGKHKLTIKTSDDIYVRLSAKKKIKYYAYVPQKHAGGIVLVAHETEYGYYKSIKSHPVMFEMIGKGKVKIMTRLLYDKTMRGRQHYSVVVQIDDNKPTVYEFETEPSTVSYFRTEHEVIPSKAGQIIVNIPEGKHNVYVYPGDSRVIAVRILVPEYMVKIK